MHAMVLHRVGSALVPEERPTPAPRAHEILVRVEACAVCRTDLHVIDGDLPSPKLPLVPGHEIVGRIETLGDDVRGFSAGQRVGIPWLGHTCGHCAYCASARENLCDSPQFTGYTRDGGFATHVVADADFTFALDGFADPVAAAPLMCAGLIGWRSLVAAGAGDQPPLLRSSGSPHGGRAEAIAKAEAIGLYGFGAAAHIIAQVCTWQGRKVYAFSRPGDQAAQQHARSLGAVWAGGSDDAPPELLDAAIIFAPVGSLVPAALKNVKKGGRVVCGGIHMSDIPSFPYRLLWEERQIVSVANLTRRDGRDFLAVAAKAPIVTHTVRYDLSEANEAISDLREGSLVGAAVLVP